MNEITCHRCDETVEEWRYTKRYGFWDTEVQNYEKKPNEVHFCKDCWNDDEGRSNGAHFWPDSAQHLWNVLHAANGSLAGTLTWWTGRPSVRIVGGEPEAAVTKPVFQSDRTVTFECRPIEDFGRERFFEDCDPPDERGLVLLKDPERTSFAGVDG